AIPADLEAVIERDVVCRARVDLVGHDIAHVVNLGGDNRELIVLCSAIHKPRQKFVRSCLAADVIRFFHETLDECMAADEQEYLRTRTIYELYMRNKIIMR